MFFFSKSPVNVSRGDRPSVGPRSGVRTSTLKSGTHSTSTRAKLEACTHLWKRSPIVLLLAIAAVFRPLLRLSESPPASSVPNIDRPCTQHWTSTVLQPSNRLDVLVCTASLRLRVPRLSTALNTTSDACYTPTCRLLSARVRL